MFGRNPNVVAQMVWQSTPQFERNQAALLVIAAIDNLGPGVIPFGYAAGMIAKDALLAVFLAGRVRRIGLSVP